MANCIHRHSSHHKPENGREKDDAASMFRRELLDLLGHMNAVDLLHFYNGSHPVSAPGRQSSSWKDVDGRIPTQWVE